MSGPPPPQRVPRDVDEARLLASQVDELTEATISRASSFSEEDRQRGVNGEWSTVSSLRHLVLVADVWLGKQIKGEDDPFHPMALPPHFMPAKLPGSSIDPDVRPTFEEACEVVRGRLAAVRAYTDGVTQEELDRSVGGHAKNVAGALGVLFDEFTFHNGFMNRDLDLIEGGA